MGPEAEAQYYTIREAAKRLRRCPRTIWNWTVEGKIKFHQLGQGCKILIPESEIRRLEDYASIIT